MGTHTLPSDETARVGALCRYRILDSPPEADFDELVQLAASIFKAPMAAITFIDQDRQWVKAAYGLDISHSDRACGLCSFTIQGTEPVVIEDASADARFSAHALVRASPQVRFYCGAPIVTHDGYAVGAIAVMDSIPRAVTDEDCLTIRRLARQAAALLELRIVRLDRAAVEERRAYYEDVLRLMAGTIRSTGLGFLQDLVEMLARSTGAEYVFCIRALPGRTRGKTVAGYGPNGPLEPLEYELAGTPCENVFRTEFCHYPKDVQALFPYDDHLRQFSIESYMGIALSPASGEPIGWIAMLHRAPLRDPAQAESFLRMIAGRAGSELGRELAEQQLKQSEERFRAAYHNATVGMSIAALDGRLQEVNQRLCTILGYSEEELLSRTFQSLTHPDDLRQHLERLQKLLDGTADSDVLEKRYIRKDGTTVWAQVGLSVIRDEAGIPLYTLALVQDITERKRAEEALQLAKYTIEHATEAIYWVGPGAELLDVNDSACSLLGYTKDEFRRMTVLDIDPTFQPDTWVAYWTEMRRLGRVSFESHHRAKDGGLIPIEVNVVSIQYKGQECHCAFVRDITKRKKAEGALARTQEKLQQALRASSTGLWDWNTETGEVFFSDEWAQQLGYEGHEIAGGFEEWQSRLHPDDHDRALAYVRNYLQHPEGHYEQEFRMRRKDGSYCWLAARASFVEEANGRKVRLIGSHADISERKQSEWERDEALSNLQTIMETVPDVIFALDLEGRVAKWNLRLETVTGYTREELQGKPALEMVPAEEAEQTAAAIREAYAQGYAELEGHLLAKDGRTMLYHWTGAPYRDSQGRVIGVTGVGRDITERKSVERMLAAEKRILELIGSDAALPAVLAEICLMIEGQSSGVFCAVMLLDDEGAHLRRGAGPSLPETYMQAIDGMAIGPSCGSCGTAAFLGRQVIVEDIATDPFWADFRDLALAHHLRACSSTPIISAAGEVLGTFSLYVSTPRHPLDELPIVARASHLACLAIERKRMESALRLTQFSIQQAVDAVFLVNAGARILDVNEAACEMLGYSRDELLSKTVHDIDTNFPRENWQARWQQLKVRKFFSYESRHQKKDGIVIQTDTTINFLVHEGREYVCAFMRDITDRKRAEAQLHLTQFAIERAGDMVFWMDESARLLLVNAAACERTGYTKDELLRMAVPDIDPHYQMEVWARHWQELRETGWQRLETQHRSKSGEVYPVEVVANFVVFEGREYNFATVRDISERKRTELRLRFSEERFRLVAQATNDVLWDWDLVTNEHWWSPNACEKFGYDAKREPSVDAWTVRLHPEDRGPILAMVRQAIGSEVQTLAAEYRFLLGDGTYGHFLDRAHIVRNEEGTAIRLIGAMIDVTGPKRAYASLEEAYRRFQAMSQELQLVESNERRRLSRELHDELGQLLTSLKFDLASVKRIVAARPKGLGPRSQERLARALETTDLLFVRLRQIVRALRPPVLEELGLKAGLEALIADVQARTGLRCSLMFEQTERRPSRGSTLETALYRIVQELLTNVMRHARATNVDIVMTTSQQEWRMTVKDDGIGFDVAGLTPTGGFGLRGIWERVEILGGYVEILSGSEAGTWVQVVIPVSSEPDPARVTDREATDWRRRRRKAVDE